MPERPTPSSKPVAEKLGIKPGHMVLVLSGEGAAGIGDLPVGAHLVPPNAAGVDAVVAFVRNRAEVDSTGPPAVAAVRPGACSGSRIRRNLR